MRACIVHGPGDVRVDEIDEPTPAAGEVSVAIRYGGICGSDLHYWHDGRVGDYTVTQPMVLGHEIVGSVDALGPGVDGPEPGTPVAIHPATPCGRCASCRGGRRNICTDTRYLGSAARTPHVNGGFQQRLIVPAEQAVALPNGLDPKVAVLAEPLAVALHAVHRAGPVFGQRVLVTGAGPIGCLVTAAARAAGAIEVLVSDILAEPLDIARQVGATHTFLASRPDGLPDNLDVAIEASGSPAALTAAARAVRRGGRLILLGLPSDQAPFPTNLAVTGELDIRGAFRFDTEFAEALRLLAGGLPVRPVMTRTVPLSDAVAAFELATDRRQACKVLLDMAA